MARANSLRLHRYEPASRANGPGLRAVVWVQGCALGCPGCFNPQSHAFDAGERWPVERLAEQILAGKDRLEGLTISGGEPAHQHRALARLLGLVRPASDLSVVVFSGYSLEELHRLPGSQAFLDGIDVLIAGRYEAARRVASGLIGSANKTVHLLTGRYTRADLARVPQAEVILSPEGEIILSGIDPLRW
jgi:anaerobic ribonucleoside-triphosphate reductase activating protein